MPIAYVRDTGHITVNGANSSNANFASLPTVGNSIIAPFANWDTTFGTSEVSDNQTSNTYARAVVNSGTTGLAHIYHCYDIVGSSGTFTLNLSHPAAGSWF